MSIQKKIELWENAESPEKFDRECFPPLGFKRLLPHHFLWWAKPYFGHDCCCCCCCSSHNQPTERGCSIDLKLEPNTFGPGRSIHVVVTGFPYQYFAEFYLQWTAVSTGQVTVDVELMSGPGISGSRLLVSGRGPSDRYLFSTRQPGTYIFKATATDTKGNTCFDTLQVDLPGI